MALSAYDCQTAGSFHLRCKFDIRTTTCHVRSDGDYARSSGLCHHHCLLLVQLGVQHVVRDLSERQHARQQFAYLHAGGTYQHRSALCHQSGDLVNHGVVLLAFGFVDTVVHIHTRNRFVGGDNDDVELVDIPELAGLCLGCTGHTGELGVHTEVVLQSNRCKRLRSSLYLHVFLGFHSLVQTVTPAAAFHDTAGLLVNDLYLVVVDDIINIFLKQRVGFQQLVDRVYALGFDTVVGQNSIFLCLLFFRRERLVLQLRHF